MASSMFDDKNIKPNDKMLSEILGKSYNRWNEIKKHLNSEYDDLIEEWKFYGKKSGWILKTLKKKRNLFFFTPVKDYFRIAFVFGDKAAAEIEKSDLPENIKVTLKNAKKYAEGRGIQIEVKSSDDIEIFRKLVKIKVNT
jgi:hypothetical protein